MSAVKRATLEALKTRLAAATGIAAAKIDTVQPDPQKDAAYPSLSIVGRTFRYEGAQRDEVSRPNGTTQLYQVGRMAGLVQIRVNGRGPAERETYESLVEREFFKTAGRAGVLECETAAIALPTGPGVNVNIGTQKVYFEYRDAEWREELTHERRRYSFVTVGCVFPVLVTETVALISQLYLLFTRDLETAYGPALPRKTYLITANGPVLQP